MTDHRDHRDHRDEPDQGDEDAKRPAGEVGDEAGPPRSSAEGVRIIGAEEAQAALEAGEASGRISDDEPRFGDVPAPPQSPRPGLRFPLAGTADPTEVAKSPVSPPEPTGGWSPPPAADMPHWTEPATGEVPRILPTGESESSEADEELDPWSAFSAGARYRGDRDTDWDETDFGAGELLHDEETRVGALVDRPDPDALFTFDDREIAERRNTGPTPAVPAEAPGAYEPLLPPPPPPEPPPQPHAPPQAQPQSPPQAQPPSAAPRPGTRAMNGPGGGLPVAGRDVRVALITGVAVGVAVLVAAKLGAAVLLLLVGAVIVLAAAELYNNLRLAGYHPATALGLAGTLCLVAAAYRNGEQAFPLVLTLVVVFGFLWYLAGVIRARPAPNLAITLFAFLWVGFLGSFAAAILRLPARHGIVFLLLPIIATVAHDSTAFFVGRAAGRTPMAPAISPNKTWEGLVGATLATIVVSVLVVAIFGMDPWNVKRALVLALVVCLVAPLGDLCESMIKRDLGVKDMGSLLPGHGGILDRVDALVFVMPATYYLLRLLDMA